MPGPQPKPPRIVEWRSQWYLFWTDPQTGKDRRQSCRAAKATTGEARKALLNAKIAELADVAGEVRRRGGRLAYDTPLVEMLDRYLQDVNEREAVRQANPSSREGLSPASAEDARNILGHFKGWLKSKNRSRTATGDVDAAMLQSYFRHVASEPARNGNRPVTRSGATVNKYRRTLRAAFGWMNTLRPPLFPDFDALATAFKPVATEADRDDAFPPSTLQAFLRCALDRESPERVVSIERRRQRVVMPNGRVLEGRDESFDQPAQALAATPVSRLFVLLTLTGCRLGEALALKWSDVDLERGRITIRASKTGRRRILPLVGAPEGDVSPTLRELLRRWRLEAGRREFVLPHPAKRTTRKKSNDGEVAEAKPTPPLAPAPLFPKGPWQCTYTEAGIDRIGPQMLRRNFVSYCASVGIPSAVAALWTGHSAAVAERWYRQQVLDRAAGDSIEAAMGLTAALQSMLNGGNMTGNAEVVSA